MPEQPGKVELLHGGLIDLPPAKRKPHEIAERIFLELSRFLAEAHAKNNAQHLGRVHHEMGYLFTGHTWLQPDVSVTHAGQKSGDYLLGAPALAVEVVSEANTANQMNGKVAEYLSQGGWKYGLCIRTVVTCGFTGPMGRQKYILESFGRMS